MTSRPVRDLRVVSSRSVARLASTLVLTLAALAGCESERLDAPPLHQFVYLEIECSAKADLCARRGRHGECVAPERHDPYEPGGPGPRCARFVIDADGGPFFEPELQGARQCRAHYCQCDGWECENCTAELVGIGRACDPDWIRGGQGGPAEDREWLECRDFATRRGSEGDRCDPVTFGRCEVQRTGSGESCRRVIASCPSGRVDVSTDDCS